MPIEVDEAAFLDRRVTELLIEREEYRKWLVQLFMEEQLEKKTGAEKEFINLRRIRQLEEAERERLLKELEMSNVLAERHEAASGKKRQEARQTEASHLLQMLRSRKAGDLKKYRSE